MLRRACRGRDKADFQSVLKQVINLLYLWFEMAFGTSRTAVAAVEVGTSGCLRQLVLNAATPST